MRPDPPRRPRFARLALALLLPALAAVAGGCVVLGAIAYKASGTPTIKAKYVPAKEPLLVFVQRSQNPADAARASDRVALLVTEDLKAHNIAPMIEPTLAMDLHRRRTGSSVWASRIDRPAAATRPATPTTGPAAATTRPAGPTTQPRTVADIGRAVGAAQVLYVDVV